MNVLLVEDDPTWPELLRRILDRTSPGSKLEVATSLRTALERLGRGPIDAILLDLGLPDSEGLDSLEKIQSVAPAVPVVVLTGSEDDELSYEAVRRGAQDYLYKGDLSTTELPRILRYAQERQRLREEVTRREQELALSRSTFASIVERSPDGILVVDEGGTVRFVNDRLEEIFGHPAASLVGNALPPGTRLASGSELEVTLRDRGPCMAEMVLGATEWRGERAQVVTLRDVTARRRAEEARRQSQEELLQSQKMEAIGRLAGGVAHDFNNLLTVILAHCEELLELLDADDPRRPITEAILKSTQRAAAVAGQLLSFGRRELRKVAVYDLREIIGGVEDMLRRAIGEDVRLTVSVPGRDAGFPAEVDRGQIEQVLMNLAVNARDAMPDGGDLTIRLAHEPSGESPGVEGPRNGCRVVLSVSDTGVGMDEKTRLHVFEPFFTTKEHGRGTGLGLSTVYGIVEQSAGQIHVESAPGRGTTFSIDLPCAEGAVVETVAEAAIPRALGGHETILVVEDDAAVRYLIGRTLERRGYDVLEAPGGKEALSIARTHSGRIDLLITDVVMPGLSGREVAERLRSMRPATKVLYMSGHTNDAVLRHGVGAGQAELMVKPFTGMTLAQTVRSVLDSSGGAVT